MSKELFVPHLRKAWPFGCLAGVLLACGIGSIVVVGNLLGTCDTSIGCPETHILASLGRALLIALLLAAPVWIACGILRWLVYPSAGALTTNSLLTGVVGFTVLLCFSPAVELMFRIER
jgi:hypothetical protein